MERLHGGSGLTAVEKVPLAMAEPVAWWVPREAQELELVVLWRCLGLFPVCTGKVCQTTGPSEAPVSKKAFRGVSAAYLVFPVFVVTCGLENTAGLCMLAWTQAFASEHVKSPGTSIYHCEAFVCNEPAGHSLAVFCCNHMPLMRNIFHLLK